MPLTIIIYVAIDFYDEETEITTPMYLLLLLQQQ